MMMQAVIVGGLHLLIGWRNLGGMRNMNEQSIVHRMEHWGYYLLPRSHPHSPGYTGLLVAIRKTPTKAHFDPKSMRLRLRDKDSIASWTTLRVKTPHRGSRHLCPGRVVLRDRMDKQVEFFAFGGSLEAASVPGETVYSLRSPAPILEITNRLESIPDQLASETEVMIGELQARWEANDEEFARRLAQVDPLQFYLASLHSILVRYKQSSTLQRSFPGFYVVLLEETEWLAEAGQWPVAPPRLEELLAPE